MPGANSGHNLKGTFSPANPSATDTWSPEPDRWYREPDHTVKYDDGKGRGTPWKPRNRWYGNGKGSHDK